MTKPHDLPSPHEVRLELRMPAPAAVVFDVFTGVDHTREWLPPEGLTLSTCEIDAREGGRFAWQMAGPDGPVSPLIEGVYLEVVPGKRLVYTNDNGDKSPDAEHVIADLSFDEEGGETLFSCRVIFPSAAKMEEWLAQGGREGVAAGNVRMAHYLQTLS
ncbi:MAG: SRPBCC domain-containing protein [Novosphingobium sp.]|nr:SRPBCC domain-containing protein [Novosphingobium sp.]